MLGAPTVLVVLASLLPLPGDAPPAGGSPGAGAPRLVCEPEILDVGEVFQGQATEGAFTLRNEGEADLVVTRIRPHCGCTVARLRDPDGRERSLPRQALIGGVEVLRIPPGGQAQIVVRYDSTGQPIREILKKVDLDTNDPTRPHLQLGLRVRVKAGVEVDPKPVRIGEVTRGRGAETIVRIRPAEGIRLRVTGVENAEEWLRAEILPVSDDDPEVTRIRLTVDPSAPVGLLSRTLVLRTDSEIVPQVRLPVFADVRSAVRFDTGNPMSDQALSFGVVGRKRDAVAEIRIENADPNVPYLLREAKIESATARELLEAHVKTIEEGVRYRVFVVFHPRGDVRFFRGTLLLRADHPDVPEKRIVFSGRVRR